MRGGGDTTPAHDTDGLAELVCSNSFRSDDASSNAVGLLHHEMRRSSSLIMAAADEHGFPPARRWRSTARLSPPRSRRASPRIPTSSRARADRRPARRRPDDHRHRPADRAAASPTHRRSDRKRCPRLLRRDRPDRPPRQHRHGRLLDGRALGQGRQGLHQLPDGPGRSIEAFIAALQRRREDRVQGVGEGHALLRGLHADRGDGRARRRHLALRPDEAGRPRRSAHRPLAATRWSSCARTTRSARCGTSSASRPS